MNKIKRRNTNQRRIIYEIVKSTDIHPTADWVYEKAREKIANISLGTVYRNLKVLVEEGKLIEINDGKVSRFDANITPHHHFKCEVCSNIYDLPEEKMSLNIEPLIADGFTINKTVIFFEGICPNCKGKIN